MMPISELIDDLRSWDFTRGGPWHGHARAIACMQQAADEIVKIKADHDRTARNRDMWKGQCERQSEQLSKLKWQHIHTAPKDGSEILLFGACHPSNSRSRYARDANVGWWATDKWVTRVGGEACDAVLWMPIPATNTIESGAVLSVASHQSNPEAS